MPDSRQPSTIPPQYTLPTPSDRETATAPQQPAEPLMREAPPTPEDWQRYHDAVRTRKSTVKAMVITLAVIMAPFIGLLFDLKAAVALLGLGLTFTTVVAWMGANRANAALRSRIRTSAILNGVLALAAFVVLAMMIANG